MTRLLLRWVLSAVALFIVTYLVPGISVNGFGILFIAALVLGLLNAIVRPVLFVLTLPLTIVTLGLFLLVLNAVVFELGAVLVPGFRVTTFWWAIIGALIYSILGVLIDWIVEKEKD
ncbi:MAG: phage holin family protein [Thermoanaerobaculia bacterium]